MNFLFLTLTPPLPLRPFPPNFPTAKHRHKSNATRPSSSTYPSESTGAGPSSTSALRTTHLRQRSKSNAEDDPEGRRRSRGGASDRNSGSSSGGDGSYVLEVGESEALDLIADGGLGDDGEVRVRAGVSKQRTWSVSKRRGKGRGGGGGGGGNTAFGGASPGGLGVFPPKLQEHPYPQRRPGHRTPGSSAWDEPRGGTGELSPCPSTSPPPPVLEPVPKTTRGAANALSTGVSGGAAPRDAVTRKGPAPAARPGPGKSKVTALLFPPPPPPPPPETTKGTGTGRGGPARTLPSTEGVSSDPPLVGAQDRHIPRDGSSGGNGKGAPVPPQGGSGWVGRMRAKAPALTLLRKGSWRSGKGKGGGGATRSFSRDGPSVGSGGRGDGAPRTAACTCGKGASECLCYARPTPAPAKREWDRRGRPLPMRTASGKLKM